MFILDVKGKESVLVKIMSKKILEKESLKKFNVMMWITNQ